MTNTRIRGKHADIADQHIPPYDGEIKHYQVYDACDAVADNQRKEDIDKACAWWAERADQLGISTYQIELFRKAMEEDEDEDN